MFRLRLQGNISTFEDKLDVKHVAPQLLAPCFL